MAIKHAGYAIGLMPTAALTTSTGLLNAALNRWSYGFYVDSAVTLNKVKAYVSALTGAPIAADITCSIHSDNNGEPGTLLQTASGNPTPGVGWLEWTGFTQALTANTQYWIVWRNLNASPAANYVTFRSGGANSAPGYMRGNNTTFGYLRKTSTDGAATWASPSGNIVGFRLEFAGGTFKGIAASDATAAVVGFGVYADREAGAKFTTPGNARLNVTGLTFLVSKTATPSAGLRFRLYQGTTLLATTFILPQVNVGAGFWNTAYFAAPVVLEPNTSYRIVMGEDTNADASTIRYNLYEYTLENNADSKALMPFGGTWQRTYWNGATWADDDTAAPAAGLILESDAPFVASGGGGPIIGSRIIVGSL